MTPKRSSTYALNIIQQIMCVPGNQYSTLIVSLISLISHFSFWWPLSIGKESGLVRRKDNSAAKIRGNAKQLSNIWCKHLSHVNLHLQFPRNVSSLDRYNLGSL